MKSSKPSPVRLVLRWLILILQGAAVGIAAILPGVSGGVLCVVFGVYEPMMELITHPISSVKKYYGIFLPFAIGWVVGFMLLAKALESLFSASTPVALMLFFGLICGALPELFKESEKRDTNALTSWTPFIISLSGAYLFFHLLENGSGRTLPPNVFSFLLCGVLWGLSLIVPGLSSSSVLIYFGLYEPMTAGIASLDLKVVIPMVIGIAVTAISLARLVNILFKKHYSAVLRIILGFVIASSVKILPDTFSGVGTLILSTVCFALGFALTRALDKSQYKKSNSTERSL